MQHLKIFWRLVLACAFSAMLTGCGRSGSQPVNYETNRLCGAILDTGLTKQCLVNNQDSTVNIVIDTNDEAARNLCIDIAGKTKSLTNGIPALWKLQIYTPYRTDKPVAVCKIN
jgi:hypothetical protein